ncbi:hypothetical protein [Rhizobium mulingense]|uniref:hypothetical protein n=1 Tax=Rhizobium mulingense TaxID=3031128 RepID=UPI003A7F23F9
MIIYRRSLAVRLSQWANVLCLPVLLFSGLQIFNTYPALYCGQYGADNDPTLMETVEHAHQVKGLTDTFNMTGFLGLSKAVADLGQLYGGNSGVLGGSRLRIVCPTAKR